MRESKYWDDFNERSKETASCIKQGLPIPVRRIAVFVTDRCNFRCEYCNSDHNGAVMDKKTFIELCEKYGKTAIIHITGGEPSTVKWLYPYLIEHGHKYKFHLNTNAFIKPPAKAVRRLKVSLDSTSPAKWDSIVGVKGAFNTVVQNIKEASRHTVTSITYTLSKKTYTDVLEFADFVNKEFPDLYAVFFSVYKGTDPEYMMDSVDCDTFFNSILPQLLPVLGEESRALILETIDEKKRLMEGTRFENNVHSGLCYLSMSERAVSPSGNHTFCSHLYRDGVFLGKPVKHAACKYGCNRRLVEFNRVVENRLSSQGEYNGKDSNQDRWK